MTDHVISVSQSATATSNVSGDTWTITPSINVAVTGTNIAFQIQDSTYMYNYGGLIAETGAALTCFGGTSHVFNNVGATISGFDGINVLDDSFLSLVNFGTIVGTDFYGIIADNNGFTEIENSGYLFGKAAGLYLSGSSGGSLDNSGVVRGFQAVHIETTSSQVNFINNSGTLRSSGNAIDVVDGILYLTNSGNITGGIRISTTTADIIVNSGHIYGAVNLGAGNDYYNGTGGTAQEINGGLGDDKLIGGDGRDIFEFNTALGPSNIDTIINFNPHIDKIGLFSSIFPTGGHGNLEATAFFEGVRAHDPSDRIIYNPGNGFLTYDSNGSAAGGAHHFATLAAHLVLTNLDFALG